MERWNKTVKFKSCPVYRLCLRSQPLSVFPGVHQHTSPSCPQYSKLSKYPTGSTREGWGVSNFQPPVLVAPWSRSDADSGKVGFYLGKEAVPRHRLQALLSRGEFDRALDLARAHSMDETDVHAARLLALLREGGEAATCEIILIITGDHSK